MQQAGRGGATKEVSFHCSRCNNRTSEVWTESRWFRSAAFRCPRCGATHHVAEGQFTVITPEMQPWQRGRKLSPWIGAEYVPVACGWYECSAMSGVECKLYWTGMCWTYLGEVVGPVHKWRGVWNDL